MDLNKAFEFIWTNARSLDRAIFEVLFLKGSPGRVLGLLRTYQNEDGGFGNALEPDLRTPESQPLFVEFALATMREMGLRDADMATRACAFLARHSDLETGIPTIFPSALRYPHAEHWTSPEALQPSEGRLIGLVGLARWQGIRHRWLLQAVDVCLDKVARTHLSDAHLIGPAFCLLESVADERDVSPLFDRLAEELPHSQWYIPHAPAQGYGLTPLDFAPRPDAFCRRLFDDAQIKSHLDELASSQSPDGGWPIAWTPPGEAARWEWRAHRTIHALAVLKAYGRL